MNNQKIHTNDKICISNINSDNNNYKLETNDNNRISYESNNENISNREINIENIY